MCIKALDLEVDLIKLDMYQKYEHKKPWFVKMNPQHTVPTLNDNDFILWERWESLHSHLVIQHWLHLDCYRISKPIHFYNTDSFIGACCL